MSAKRNSAIAAALLAVVTLTVGCSEKEQVIVYEQGKYQGKPDTKPWENAPADSLHTTSTWTKGDKTSWEHALNSRTQKQNEYTRVE